MEKQKKCYLRGFLLIVFAVMFVVGMFSPEVNVVVKKATNICLECIGIGG